MEDEKYEIIAHVSRIFSEKADAWLPAINIINTHDHHPAWTAALMYLILDRYVSTVDDKNQEEYIENVLKNFKGMLEIGPNYLFKVSSVDEVE